MIKERIGKYLTWNQLPNLVTTHSVGGVVPGCGSLSVGGVVTGCGSLWRVVLYLGLAAGGVLHHGLGQGGAGGEAAEEGGDDVAAADGQHLLVGTHRVAVLLGKHLRQRHGEGKAGKQPGFTLQLKPFLNVVKHHPDVERWLDELPFSPWVDRTNW